MTNSAALAALATLRTIDSNMEKTQNSISSGYRIDTAKDGAAYWSIATTMRSDNKALTTVEDALGLAAAKTDTAYSGLSTSINIVSDIKAKLVAAREPGVDKEKINKELTELKNQLSSVAQSASFSGENWLYNDTTAAAGTKEMVGSFIRKGDGTVSIQTVDFDTSKSVLIDTKAANKGLLTQGVGVTQPSGTTTSNQTYFLINSTTTGQTGSEVKLTSVTTDDNLEGMIMAVDTMLKNMTDAAATLGAVNSRIELQNNFVKSLGDVIDKGVGRLVDADMNEESTKLKALQTQQQLGIQALSIANGNAQNILSLFR
jgi:flagellin